MAPLPPHAPATLSMSAPECRPGALRLRLDGRDGDFNGMSHSGVLVILQNRGPRACRVPGLPRVEALTAGGAVLPVTRRAPVGMRPGPVVVPLRMAPGAVASTPLRWVAGPVFPHSRCFTPAALRVTAGAVVLKAPWDGGQVCGEAGGPATFEQPVLRPGLDDAAP